MCSFRPGTGAFATVHPSPILSKGTWDCRRGNCRQARPPPCRAVPSRGKTADRHRFGNEDEPPMNTNRHQTDGPPSMTSAPECFCDICSLGVTRSWDEAPRERGRPARTNLPAASPISSTRIDRQRRQGSASAGPMRLPPAGWPAATSQGDRAVGKGRGCGRDARAPGGCRHRWCGGGYPAGVFSESRPASFGKLPLACGPCPLTLPGGGS